MPSGFMALCYSLTTNRKLVVNHCSGQRIREFLAVRVSLSPARTYERGDGHDRWSHGLLVLSDSDPQIGCHPMVNSRISCCPNFPFSSPHTLFVGLL